jgi:hypothetical protein
MASHLPSAPASKSSLKRSSGIITPAFSGLRKSSNLTNGTLVYTIKGRKLPPAAVSDNITIWLIMAKGVIQWCSGCREGETMVLCTVCKDISFCTDCMDFDSKGDEESIPFQCPSCFLKKDKLGIYVRSSLHILSLIFRGCFRNQPRLVEVAFVIKCSESHWS